jgi:hypothetical protein
MLATYTSNLSKTCPVYTLSNDSTDNDVAAKHLLKGVAEIVIINDGMKTVPSSPSYTSAVYSSMTLSSSVLRFRKL